MNERAGAGRSQLLTLGANVTTLFCGLVSSVLLSRWLGPAGRGEATAVLLWPMLLVYLSALGQSPAVVCFGADKAGRSGRVLGSALVVAAAGTCVALATGVLGLPVVLGSYRSEVVRAARLFLVVIPVSHASQICLAMLQARQCFGAYNFARIIIPVGYAVGIPVLGHAGRLDLRSLVELQLGLNALVLLVALSGLQRSGLLVGLGCDRALARRLLHFGRRAYLGEVCVLANLRLDQALISAFLPADQLGLYMAAVSAANVGGVVSGAMRVVMQPAVAAAPRDTDRYPLLARTLSTYWTVGIPLHLLLLAVLPVGMPAVFGRGFEGAVGTAAVLVLASPFLGAKDIIGGALQSSGNPGKASMVELLGAGLTVTILPLAVRSLGIMGAAVATLVVYALQLAFAKHAAARLRAPEACPGLGSLSVSSAPP